MALFQKSIVNKYIADLDKNPKNMLDQKFNNFRDCFGDSKKQANIRGLKEEQYQEGFLRDLFVNIFNYTLNPAENYNLTTEFRNVSNSKRADGAILKEGNAIAVIELKGTDTPNLDSVESQAFGYKNNQPNCIYVITSNFEKLRFYIQNTVEYLEFDLFDLATVTENMAEMNAKKEKFKLLWLCLSHDNLTADVPLTMKKQSVHNEEEVSKLLYKDYSTFRNVIFYNLVQSNPDRDKLVLFKKTQKLLDRFLFVFFAEDRLLIPPNSISDIINQWKTLRDLDAYIPLYDRFKKFFEYLNVGHKGKPHDIFAYNGGLFAPDEVLDKIHIDDNLLAEYTQKLSDYDFSETNNNDDIFDSKSTTTIDSSNQNKYIDVNILGHIFEHSLNDIEEIQNELSNNISQKSTKRRKDGIYYTPKYITKYIVKNTVGKLCEEKKATLGIHDIDLSENYTLQNPRTILEKVNLETIGGEKKVLKKERKTSISAKGEQLLKKLDNYRQWLLNITIVDPACGSGAFLNQTLEFLIEEHNYISDIESKISNQTRQFLEIENHILEQNIFGVDINEEAVEIAKLSLWLRTAQKGRKLSSLNNNIKCGNSLINDPADAGEKAFNWQEEFPHVFEDGGFDVVIGNPPYVKEYTNKSAFDGLHNHYCYQGKMDLWYFFGALAIEICKKEIGLIGFIAPNNWTTNSGASKFRNIVLEKGKLIQFIDFGNFKVFESAGIQTMIYIMKHTCDNHEYEFEFAKVLDSKIDHISNNLFLQKKVDNRFEYFDAKISKSTFQDSTFNFVNNTIEEVIEKILQIQYTNLLKEEVAQGIVPPQDFLNRKNSMILGDNFTIGQGIFNLSLEEYNKLNLNPTEMKLVKPFYTTEELHRYWGNSNHNYYVIYTGSMFKNLKAIEPYPNIKRHLDQFSKIITSDNKPYGLHRAREEKFFKGEKIMSVRKCAIPTFTFTDFDCYVSQTYFVIKTERIDQKYLTAILNSKVIAFWLKYRGKMQGDNYQIDKEPLLGIPIVLTSKEIVQEINLQVSNIIAFKQKQHDYGKLLLDAKNSNNFDREILLSKELDQMTKNIEQLEQEINTTIYDIYGLKSKQIDIIENNV